MIQLEEINKLQDVVSPLGDTVTLTENIDRLASSYRDAKPFPYLVIDNMFSNVLLDQLMDEIPPVNDDHWVHHDHEHEEKYGLRSALDLGPSGFRLTTLLHSAAFLYFLSEVTGIWRLLPDPYLQGSGYSLMPEGSKFDVHIDRNTAYETGLLRRIALIIYLNKDWKHEYGGQLELWNLEGTRCESAIEPLFNRTAIFEVSERSYHGVPAPIAAPFGRSRNSFIVYYHTAASDQGNVAPHTSIYAPARYRQKQPLLRKLIKDVMPPILLRKFRKFRPPSVH
jgi:hypothetical protein